MNKVCINCKEKLKELFNSPFMAHIPEEEREGVLNDLVDAIETAAKSLKLTPTETLNNEPI